MPADAPVVSAVFAPKGSLFPNFAPRIHALVPGRVRTSRHDHAHGHPRGPGSLLGGGIPLGACDTVLSGEAARAGGGQSGADAVPAGSRPDRSLEGVPE